MIIAALKAAYQLHFVADLQVGRIPGRASPRDAGDIIALAIGTIHCQHQVGNFPSKGRGTVAGSLAQCAGQLDAVRILFIFLRQKPLGKGGDQQPPGALHHLVIAAKLAVQTQDAPGGNGFVDQQTFAQRNGQKVLRAAEPWHPKCRNEKLFPEKFMTELQWLAYVSP